MNNSWSQLTRPPPANFDRIARAYRWLEYLTLGSVLQRTRTCFLPSLIDCRSALLFGDGDGRFLAKLLEQNPSLTADAVDTSSVMLDLLRRRAMPFAVSPEMKFISADRTAVSRVRTHHQDALAYIPDLAPDLIVTHFFLDCLTQATLEEFIGRLAPHLAPEALWVVSEFHVPPGILALPAGFLIRTLYLAFRFLTGLSVSRLPEHATTLKRTGFIRVACRQYLFGLLVAEQWQRSSSKSPPGPEGATRLKLGYPHT